jgi:hypothetical protein
VKNRWILIGTIISFLGIFLFGIHPSAATLAKDGDRNRKVQINVNQFVWEALSNNTGKSLCEITIEYDRKPSTDEIIAACANWFVAPEQPASAENTTPYPTQQVFSQNQFLQSITLNLKATNQFVKTVTIPMQDMTVDIIVPEGVMSEPYVVLSAYEPEPAYQITAIRGFLNGSSFICDKSICRVPIKTDSSLEFWSISSYGDESSHVKATLRQLKKTEGTTLVIDQLSPIRLYTDACSLIWNTSKSISTADWATFPSTPDYLHTNKKYYYLAGKLIRSKFVDASNCPGGGLLSDGSPNACGMERSTVEMIRWQNQYDTMIWSTGRNIGVPPAIVKTLIEIESQFWPSNIRLYVFEYGLAQLNQYGADVALRWDNDLYKQICNGLFYDCNLAYASQSPSMQAILRGGLVRAINADCPTCQNGIDFSKAVETVPTVARVLRANCQQTKYILNQYNVKPTYEDAWKFTLVSYHSGFYCLNDAIHSTNSSGLAITWENVSTRINPYCFGGADYVNEFWKSLTTFSSYRIKPDLSPQNLPQSTLIPTPVPTSTPVPTLTPTPVFVNSKIRVLAFVDKNNNGVYDEGEGVDNLSVIITIKNGPVMFQKSNNGTAFFDMSGIVLDSTAIVSLPTQFQTKTVTVQAIGEVQVTFQLQQSLLPPTLP